MCLEVVLVKRQEKLVDENPTQALSDWSEKYYHTATLRSLFHFYALREKKSNGRGTPRLDTKICDSLNLEFLIPQSRVKSRN